MWGDNISTVEGIQYCGGIPSVLLGIPSLLWRTSVQWGIASVLWRVFITLEDNISTVEGTQSLIMTKRYRRFCITKFSFGSFSKIPADFMPFENWTGVL